jgi:glycine/D-amino acid oxidase-like deaminating enzyme
MAPRVDPVTSDESLPARVDVVIVGGGIIGTSTALFLAQRGVSVALCEKGQIACEQSSRNWGWCRKMVRDPRELPLAIESLRLWQGMNKMVAAETGFRNAGLMYLAETPADLARLESWLDHARQHQLDTRIISGREVAQRLPSLAKDYAGALYTASDGKGEPQMAAPAIALAARRARHRDRSRPNRRCGDRKGCYRVRSGGTSWRRLVAPLLRQSGNRFAAVERRRLGYAY